MNSLYYKNAPQEEINKINILCQQIHHHHFRVAESTLLDILEDITSKELNTADDAKKALIIVNTLYHNFNAYYLFWLESNDLQTAADLKKLSDSTHPNVLLAHCTDPESMDDLLYEVKTYLYNFENDKQYEEVQYHLDCYKGHLVP